jgi:chromosome segregation ATPase
MAWKEKARFEDDEIFLARRSTSKLRMILDRVERIWEEMGLDMESTASVRGKTLEERLAWLEARILILDEEIKEVKAEILAVGGDPDNREKMACMVSPERIAAVLDHMEERLTWYHEQIELHEEELARLLSAGKCGVADA